jgi:hypothetical protein
LAIKLQASQAKIIAYLLKGHSLLKNQENIPFIEAMMCIFSLFFLELIPIVKSVLYSAPMAKNKTTRFFGNELEEFV